MSEHTPHSGPSPEVNPRSVQWIRDNSLPIIVILLIGMASCLIAHYPAIKVDWSTTHDFTGSLQDVVQVFAFLGGGLWAYFKFVKGRTFKESLSPAVTGRLVRLDGGVHLVAAVQIKNVGSSKTDFHQESSALILYEYTPSSAGGMLTVDDKRGFAIFDDKDRYIEPNEIIEIQRFISIPDPIKTAYRLEVEILSKSGFTWTAANIVDKTALRDNAVELIGL